MRRSFLGRALAILVPTLLWACVEGDPAAPETENCTTYVDTVAGAVVETVICINLGDEVCFCDVVGETMADPLRTGTDAAVVRPRHLTENHD